MKKSIPEIREQEGNEKIHSHNSGTGIRGFHSWEWTGTGIPAHPCIFSSQATAQTCCLPLSSAKSTQSGPTSPVTRTAGNILLCCCYCCCCCCTNSTSLGLHHQLSLLCQLNPVRENFGKDS